MNKIPFLLWLATPWSYINAEVSYNVSWFIHINCVEPSLHVNHARSPSQLCLNLDADCFSINTRDYGSCWKSRLLLHTHRSGSINGEEQTVVALGQVLRNPFPISNRACIDQALPVQMGPFPSSLLWSYFGPWSQRNFTYLYTCVRLNEKKLELEMVRQDFRIILHWNKSVTSSGCWLWWHHWGLSDFRHKIKAFWWRVSAWTIDCLFLSLDAAWPVELLQSFYYLFSDMMQNTLITPSEPHCPTGQFTMTN